MAGLDLSGFDDAVKAQPQAAPTKALDLSHFDEAMKPASPSPDQNPPGALESLARGAEQGATVDFAPRINAGLASFMNSLKGQPANYDQELKDSQSRMTAAQASHPWLYGAGNVVGMAAPLAVPGAGEALEGIGIGTKGLRGAIQTGAAYGAATGVGSSKDLTDVGDVAKNALAGAGVGAAGGAVMGVAQDALSPFFRQGSNLAKGAASTVKNIGPWGTATDAYTEGAAGNGLWGEQPHTEASRNVVAAIGDAGNTLKNALSEAGQAQGAALASDQPVTNISKWANAASQAAEKGKNAQSFQADRNAIDQVMGVVNEFIHGTGEEGAVPGRGTMVTPVQANQLRQQLGALGTLGNDAMNNPVGRQFANRLISELKHGPNQVESSFGLPDDFVPLKTTINNSIQNLAPANQRIHQLLLAQDMLPDASTLGNAEKATMSGASASSDLQDFYKALPDDIRAQIQPSLDSVAKTKAVADKINAGGLNRGAFNLAETGRGMLYGMSNLAGSAVNGVQKAATATGQELAQGNIGAIFKTMYNQTPETFNTIGQKMMQAGGVSADIGKALVGAAQKDNYGRNAIIFALQQNPSYRDAVEKAFGNGQGVPANPPQSTAQQREYTQQ
jgi:hypothetical protein